MGITTLVIQDNPAGRYELHIAGRLFHSPPFYVVDKVKGVKCRWGTWPEEMVDRMRSDLNSVCHDIHIYEEDCPEVRAPRYGQWALVVPDKEPWLEGHRILKWLFEQFPRIDLILNEAGVDLDHHERGLTGAGL